METKNFLSILKSYEREKISLTIVSESIDQEEDTLCKSIDKISPKLESLTQDFEILNKTENQKVVYYFKKGSLNGFDEYKSNIIDNRINDITYLIENCKSKLRQLAKRIDDLRNQRMECLGKIAQCWENIETVNRIITKIQLSPQDFVEYEVVSFSENDQVISLTLLKKKYNRDKVTVFITEVKYKKNKQLDKWYKIKKSSTNELSRDESTKLNEITRKYKLNGK